MVKESAEGMKILHVTEASGGGVLQVISQLARHQRKVGASVKVAMTDRYDSPSKRDLESKFGDSSLLSLGGGATTTKLWRIFKFVRSSLANPNIDVIHLHSSYAGLAGRLAVMSKFGSAPSVVYSAHAYGFLRSDLPKISRLLIYVAEAFLFRFSSGTVAISNSEATLARRLGTPDKVRTLENCLQLPPLAVPQQDRLLVANIGRLVPQKGPERFALAADRLSSSADFRWIGGPTSETDPSEMGDNVHVTGNLSHSDALESLSQASVHLFTSRWEGMPLALMESQAMGIPAVAWECSGVSDVIVEGETGFIVRSETEMLKRLSSLLEDSVLREETTMKAAAARFRFSDENYGESSLEVYRQLRCLNLQTGNAESAKGLPVE